MNMNILPPNTREFKVFQDKASDLVDLPVMQGGQSRIPDNAFILASVDDNDKLVGAVVVYDWSLDDRTAYMTSFEINGASSRLWSREFILNFYDWLFLHLKLRTVYTSVSHDNQFLKSFRKFGFQEIILPNKRATGNEHVLWYTSMQWDALRPNYSGVNAMRKERIHKYAHAIYDLIPNRAREILGDKVYGYIKNGERIR